MTVPASGQRVSGAGSSGYRLPAATRMGVVRLQVRDLARSQRYYERVLGLSVLRQDGDVLHLGPEGGAPLVELHERPDAAPVLRRGRLGLYHYALLLPNRAALGRFIRHLAALGVRAGMSDHLVSEAVYLNDPDGLGIEVYADRPRATWRYESGQLAMDTRPLDVDDVLNIAGSELWAGFPNGTVVGHIHLHVGDLERAEAFYSTGLGLDKTVWSYPGALFLSAGGYHHHLGLNTWATGAPSAAESDARLLEWELVVPPGHSRVPLANLAATGVPLEQTGNGGVVRDPWGTALRIREEPS
ncbi:MAG TPA: VOC family protein [Gemmatimonadales bacterium]|nr:VOC family protein [Gemmatimonadales bacterium]